MVNLVTVLEIVLGVLIALALVALAQRYLFPGKNNGLSRVNRRPPNNMVMTPNAKNMRNPNASSAVPLLPSTPAANGNTRNNLGNVR